MKKYAGLAVRILALLAVAAAQSSACPVCFGEKGSPMTDGLNWAIVFLLGVTGTVLSALGAFFLRMKKRARMTLNGDVDPPGTN